MNSALVFGSIGGVALVAAMVARMVAASSKPTSPKSPQEQPQSDTTEPDLTKADTTKPETTESGASTLSKGENVATMANVEEEEIEWQDSADVYAPAMVVASEFVSTLGLARPPAILPQQDYIFVNRVALDKVQAHLRGNVEVEQGGLLLGQAFFDGSLKTYLLVIHDALPAPDGVETPTFFGYTTASWRALTPQLQQMHPDWTVIGSYHSHPNMGVFLSETDLGTQEEIFCADWQIALVIDPVKDEIGFFVGKDGEKCGEWYLVKG